MDFLSNFLNDTLLVSLSKTLLHFVWQGAALALVLFLLLKLVDKQHSRARYLISLFIFGLNVVVPTLTFLHFNEVHTAVVAVEHVTGNVPVVAPSQASLIVESAVSFDWQLLLPIIAVSWLVGVCWLSAQLIYEVHKVNQLPRQGTSEVEQHIQELFERLTHQLKANPLTRLMVSTKAEVPMVIGWLKPVVLVPTSMIVGLTPVQLEMLLAHELAHVKRHDYLINFFQTLVEVLFFFHPCVKWISNQIRVEREYCCDDIAVGCCGSPTAYARALTNAELIRRENIPQLAMAATGGDLKKRVLRLVDQQHDCSAKPSNSLVSTLVAGFTGIGLVLVFVAAPHMATAELAPDAQFDSAAIDLSENLDIPNTYVKEDEKVFESTASEQSRDEEVVLPPVDSVEVLTEETELKGDELTAFEEASDEVQETLNTEDTEPFDTLVHEQNDVLPPSESDEEVRNDVIEEIQVADDQVNNSSFVALDNDVNQVSDIPVVDQISQLNKPLVEEVQKAQERIESVIVDPKLVRSFAPKYPEKALRKGMEAEFSVTFTVDANGKVVEPRFESDVDKKFQRAVRLALKRWRFEAGTVDGKKQSMEMTRVFSFAEPGDSEYYYITGSRLPRRRY